jgi:hypothetical protein
MFKKMLVLILTIGLVAGFSSNVLADSSATADANTSVGIDNSDRSAASIDDHSTNTSKVYNRQFVNPGNVPFPQTNGFFTAPTPDSSFRQVRELIFALTGDPNATSVNLTEGACEELAKGGDVESNIQIVRDRLRVAKADQDGTRWITLSMIAPIVQDGKLVGVKKTDFRVAGFAVAEADDGDTDSFQVIGKLADQAIEAGYASNEAGPEDRPWVQANIGLGLVRNFDREPVEYEAPVTK